MADTILEVINLVKYFEVPAGSLHAVDNISFSIRKGQTLGLVGESGCGKSTTGRAILRLIEPNSGQVIFDGKDVTKLSKNEMRAIRKDMQIIFQDPFSSLDPRMTIRQLVGEPMITTGYLKDKNKVDERIRELMGLVGLGERLINSYPHELDGGRRQRIGIARALAVDPKFIVCDEPVSALDVSIQAQILNLIEELQDRLGLTFIFITHDLAVVNHLADNVAVMYLGQLVEKAPTEELFLHPMHPYTQALLSAIPSPVLSKKKNRILLKGEITSPINLPDTCRFAKRCNYFCEACKGPNPALTETRPDHYVACYNPLF